MTGQLTAEQLVGMTPHQISQAREAGQLDSYMAQVNTPTSTASPYTVPTDPVTGRPVSQLGKADVAAMTPEGISAALTAGRLVAYMAGDDNPPAPEREKPVRASFQFTEAHVELMTSEDLEQFRAEGKLVDYDDTHPAEPAEPVVSAGGAEL